MECLSRMLPTNVKKLTGMSSGWAWACEADHMVTWTPMDKHGENAFRESRRIVSKKRPPHKPRILLKRINKILGDLSGEEAMCDIETALVEVYSSLHTDAAIRKKCAEKRFIKLDAIADEDQLDKYMTPLKTRIWYWMRPMLIFMVCFSMQSLLLHIATHYYVMYMIDVSTFMGQPSNVTTLDLALMPATSIRNGQLFDTVGHDLKRIGEQTSVLDASGIIPAMLCVGSYMITSWMGDCHIGLWGKTFIIASIMALIKGVFDLITILPDSSGWENCQERLGPEGIEQFKNEFNFTADFMGALLKMLGYEVSHPGQLRYCADMMVSGHTYFAALFSLSTYKMLKYSTQTPPSRKWIRYAVAVILIACLATEVILVALSKFHYTVDMAASIVLVVILWDSIRIETIASHLSEGYFWRDPNWERKSVVKTILGMKPSLQQRKKRYEVVTSRSRKLLNISMVWQSMCDDPIPDPDESGSDLEDQASEDAIERVA